MFRKQHPSPGARPGTLSIDDNALPTRIRITQYSPDKVTELESSDAGPLNELVSDDAVLWIDIQGFADESKLREIAEQFQIHPLALEDIVNVPQRPKAEWFDDQLLLIARIVTMPSPRSLKSAQLSIVASKGVVITFQDRYTEHLAAVHQRINIPTSRLRRNGPDYLTYVILDTAIDAAYPVLEALGEQLEWIEQRTITHPDPKILQQTNAIKNQLLNLRRTIWPQRDAIHSLMVTDSDFVNDHVRKFLSDTYDHSVQTAEVIEMYREMATGLVTTYLSAVSHRSNEVMKMLTLMSSIFVPLTFVAGIYGMNFENMPELGYAWGYPLVCGTMVAMAAGMIGYFWRRGWVTIARLDSRDGIPPGGQATQTTARSQSDPAPTQEPQSPGTVSWPVVSSDPPPEQIRRAS